MQIRPRLAQVTRRPLEVRTPGPRFSGVRRILVVRHDRLGDVVSTLPAAAALRSAYPAAHLALLVQSRTAPLVRMVRDIDEVLEIPPGRGALALRIREARPDLILCVSRGARVAWAAARARIRHRVGAGYRYYSRLFGRSVAERRRAGGRHEVEYALSFAHRAGASPEPARFPLTVPDGASRVTDDWLRAQGICHERFVVLHPGAGGSCPSWPVGHWLTLASLLRESGLPVVLSVGPQDAAVAAALDAAAELVRGLPRFDGTLPELAALAARAGMFASNSTGPLHVAVALGTPTLGIFPPWASCGVQRWGPYAENGWALVVEADAALDWSRRKRRLHGPALMSELRPDLAARCLIDLLEGKTPRL